MLSFESRKQSESNCIKCFSAKILKYKSLACYSIFLLFLGGNKMELQLSSRQLFYYILFPSAHWRKHWCCSPFPPLPMKKSHSPCCSTHSGELRYSIWVVQANASFALHIKGKIAKNRGICTALSAWTAQRVACCASSCCGRLTSLLFSHWKADLQSPLSQRETDPWKGLAWNGLTPWKLCLEMLGDCYVYVLAISVRDKLFSHPLKHLVVYLLFILKIDLGYIFLIQGSH